MEQVSEQSRHFPTARSRIAHKTARLLSSARGNQLRVLRVFAHAKLVHSIFVGIAHRQHRPLYRVYRALQAFVALHAGVAFQLAASQFEHFFALGDDFENRDRNFCFHKRYNFGICF